MLKMVTGKTPLPRILKKPNKKITTAIIAVTAINKTPNKIILVIVPFLSALKEKENCSFSCMMTNVKKFLKDSLKLAKI